MALGSAPQGEGDGAVKTYGTLTLVDGGQAWEMRDIPPHVAIRLKHLFPRIPKTSIGPFRFPNDRVHAADLTWFLQRYPMRMGAGDLDALRRGRAAHDRELSEREAILTPGFVPPQYAGLAESAALRGYQSQAVELLRSRGGLLVGDEVGLGKTFIGVAGGLIDPSSPTIIVVEPHVQEQWHERVEAFTNLKAHSIKKTKPYALPEAQVYIFRYSNIAGWVDVFGEMNIGAVVWDEIQSLRKGPDSAKGAASMILSQRAQYRLGLTATPIYNYGAEIYEVMRFLDRDVLGEKHEFKREWCTEMGYLRDPEALGAYLRDQHVFLRRTRADVGRELPPVNTVVEPIGYDVKQVRSADELARTLALRAVEGSFTERGQATRELDVLMRHRTGVAKAEAVADYVRILLESSDKPIVLVGWHRDVYDIWLERLSDFTPVMYTGSESATQKRASEVAFLSGESRLLIMSLRSGAGLDSLHEICDTVVFGELDWSPGIHHQVIGRFDRDRADGVPNHVMALFLVAEDGSDPPMMEVLGLKASEARAVVDPSLGPQRRHSDRSHLNALVARYLSRGKRKEAGLLNA